MDGDASVGMEKTAKTWPAKGRNSNSTTESTLVASHKLGAYVELASDKLKPKTVFHHSLLISFAFCSP